MAIVASMPFITGISMSMNIRLYICYLFEMISSIISRAYFPLKAISIVYVTAFLNYLSNKPLLYYKNCNVYELIFLFSFFLLLLLLMICLAHVHHKNFFFLSTIKVKLANLKSVYIVDCIIYYQNF